jgi:hypothetical protein
MSRHLAPVAALAVAALAEQHRRDLIAGAEAHRIARFDRSIHLPEDEICFYVFDAPSAREAALAAQRAGLDPLRVVEAVSSGNEEQ